MRHGRVADPRLACIGSDRRDAKRHGTFLAGRIRALDGASTLCVVRDMSRSGALLAVHPEAVLPPVFDLHVLSREEVFHGVLAWRDEDLAGMRFCLTSAVAKMSGKGAV